MLKAKVQMSNEWVKMTKIRGRILERFVSLNILMFHHSVLHRFFLPFNPWIWFDIDSVWVHHFVRTLSFGRNVALPAGRQEGAPYD